MKKVDAYVARMIERRLLLLSCRHVRPQLGHRVGQASTTQISFSPFRVDDVSVAHKAKPTTAIGIVRSCEAGCGAGRLFFPQQRTWWQTVSNARERSRQGQGFSLCSTSYPDRAAGAKPRLGRALFGSLAQTKLIFGFGPRLQRWWAAQAGVKLCSFNG